MAVTILQLVAKISADTKSAEAGIIRTANTAKTALAPMAMLGAGTVLAAVAVGVAATKMAGDFQQGITTLQTGAGESAKNIKMVSDGILAMTTETGTSTKQLVDGMYMIESAGYHGQKGLDVLKAAAMGARVGNADLGTVADATTTIMKDFSAQGITAAQAVNALVATVASGKTHMQDLGQSLAMILPTASAAHVGLNDVMGAMATMTGEGVPAANAATYLRQMIIALDAPSGAATKALREIGLSSDDVATKMQKSLPDALKMITDALKKKFPEGSAAYVRALRDISGGAREMQGMLDLTGAHLKDFQTNVGGIGGAVKNGGNAIAGWSEVQKDFNFRLAQAREVGEKLMIELGQHLLPAATRFIGFIADNAIPALRNFTNWMTGSSQSASIIRPILIALAVAIGGALVASMVAWAGAALLAAGAMIAATWPVLAIGAAIALLVGGVIYAYTHWTWFHNLIQAAIPTLKDVAAHVQVFASELSTRLGPAAKNVFDFLKTALGFLQGMWNAVWPGLALVLSGVWDMIKGVVQITWSIVSGIIKVGLDILGGNWKQAWTDIKEMFSGIWDGIKSILLGTLKVMIGLVLSAVEQMLGLLANIPGPIGDMAKGALKAVKGLADQMRSLGQDAGGAYAAGLADQQAAVAAAGRALNRSAANAAGGSRSHFAKGGVTDGGIVEVGEEGRELAIFPPGTRIIPHAQTEALLGSGGSGANMLPLPHGLPSGGGGASSGSQVIEIHLTTTLDGRVVAQSVARHLPTVIRNATGARAF